jgi:signal transduction histidine kinase
MLDEQLIRTLAPVALVNRRASRFIGFVDGTNTTLAGFDTASAATVRRLYAALVSLEALFRQAEPVTPLHLAQHLDALDWRELLGAVRGLSEQGDEACARALHDLRGGALQAVVVLLQRAVEQSGDAVDSVRIGLLLRDHCKIMQQSISDLDPLAPDDPLAQQCDTTELVAPWRAGAWPGEAGDTTITVHCAHNITIAAWCIEAGAIDRVLYNLLNNAARHSADSHVELAVWPLSMPQPRDVRFVVANRVRAADLAGLQRSLADLQRGPFSQVDASAPHGRGLRICAELVAHAYGIADPLRAVREGHVGIGLYDDLCVAHAHWPVLTRADAAERAACV